MCSEFGMLITDVERERVKSKIIGSNNKIVIWFMQVRAVPESNSVMKIGLQITLFKQDFIYSLFIK